MGLRSFIGDGEAAQFRVATNDEGGSMIEIESVIGKITHGGYILRQEETLALRGLLGKRPHACGVPALLIEGQPGVGKTALGEALASAIDAELVFDQLHQWSDFEGMCVGVDVAAAVAGDADKVRQPGVLARAAETSLTKMCVLVLDEVDKAPQKTESLFLDWLQSGRTPIAPGRHIVAIPWRFGAGHGVIAVLTSNATRPMSDALLRRVRRTYLRPLGAAVEDEIVYKRTGASKGVVKIACELARIVRNVDQGAVPFISIQELVLLVSELAWSAQSIDDVRLAVGSWAARSDKGIEVAKTHKSVVALWSEILRGRHG